MNNPEKTEREIKNGQFRENGKIGHTRRRQIKQNYNTICVGHQTDRIKYIVRS